MNDFRPVSIGQKGRRAIAWFGSDGLVVQATDASAAGHAISVVLEALAESGQGEQILRYLTWAEEAVQSFPFSPPAGDRPREHRSGRIDRDPVAHSIGYGYVKPANGGYQCGGALFFRAEHRVQLLAAAPVWISGEGL